MQLPALDSALPANEEEIAADPRRTATTAEIPEGRRLEIKEVKAGLHEIAEGILLRPIYRISWPGKPRNPSGWLALSGKKHSEKYVKLPYHQVVAPPRAFSGYCQDGDRQRVEERGAFLSTHLTDTSLNVVFAVRIGRAWMELSQWRTSWSELGLSRLDVCRF
jgi:hypothetical protein